ncbi:FAD-binding oxidoreductase [Kribbella sp. NPDC051952]|uniref:FAD-binding oxidoreductase n=1 Tax=Kribbella sp. NPDC051952 TaxID=3154851 RepID=UPI00342049FB
MIDLIGPDHELYDVLRVPAQWSFRDVRPTAIARCSSVDDVVEALAYARNSGLHVVPRGGGHCFAGRSSTDGLVLDLGGLNSVDVGSDGLATIGAGARLAAVYQGLHSHGLTIPAGCGPTVGIAGLTLGGGLGLLGRRYGLTCDRLVAATVVLADGRVIICDEKHDPDLFWALRGAGGGQFGIVTALVFDPVPSPAATRFAVSWPASEAAEVIAAWQEWAPDAVDDLTASLAVTPAEVRVFGAALRPPAETADLLADLPGGDLDLRDGLSWPELKDSLVGPEGDPTAISKSEFFQRALPADVVTGLLAQGCELNFTPLGGAYNRVPADATAFVHRGERFVLEHLGTDREQVRRSWTIAHPHASGRVYPNFPDPDLTDWVEAYHGPNHARLAAIRQHYDPERVFHFPQSL